MRIHHSLLPLTLTLSLFVGACDPSDQYVDSDEAPLSDIDALLRGAPTNDEIPLLPVKADLPVPAVYTDLLELQTPVKSQGSRGVCSIFSSTALMEHLYLKAGMDDPDFSEQYLQWSTKFQLGVFTDTSGSNDQYNLQAINRFGVPVEEAWPYESFQWGPSDDSECDGTDPEPTRCYTNGAPPAEAVAAEKFMLPASMWLNSSRNNIKQHMLATQTAAVVGLDFFYQAWNHRLSTLPRNMDYWAQGVVQFPNTDDVRVSREKPAGHAILLVGWDENLEFPIRDAQGNFVRDANGNLVMERGYFIFKNSWGTGSFGVDNPHGAGYGFISMRYIEQYGRARVAGLPNWQAPVDPVDPEEPVEGNRFENSTQIAVPDNDPAGIVSTIEVPSTSTGTVNSVVVRASFTHTWRGDLLVRLRHGDRVITLHDRSGGGQDNLEIELETSDFAGLAMSGAWTIEVSDTASSDRGSLDRWSIELR